MYLRLDGDRIAEASFWADGCLSTMACGDMLTTMAQGMALEAAAAITPEELIAALGRPALQEPSLRGAVGGDAPRGDCQPSHRLGCRAGLRGQSESLDVNSSASRLQHGIICVCNSRRPSEGNTEDTDQKHGQVMPCRN